MPSTSRSPIAPTRFNGSPRRAPLPPGPALLTLDEAGTVVRREAPRRTPAPLRRLRVLAYRADSERVVSVDVPFWSPHEGPEAGLRFQKKR